MKITSGLDSIDRKILRVVQSDANLSTAEIADRIGLSQAPCWRRIKRLEEDGIITGRVTLVDRKAVGLSVMVFTQIKLTVHGSSSLPEFEEAIRHFPEVIECYTLMGPTDYLLKILVKSIEDYEIFFRDHLSKLPAVRETNSTIALSEIKNTTVIPIEK